MAVAIEGFISGDTESFPVITSYSWTATSRENVELTP